MSQYLDGRVTLHCGDCLAVLPTLEENSVDSCVTDPPYHFASIVKRWSGKGPPPVDGVYRRSTSGFMGKAWDGGDIAFQPETWAQVLRVLKPGAHLLAFGAPKNFHRLVCAIEDGGFEIRDCVQWIFGSGFPKSHNQPGGWGTALKPAYEPIILARKPLIGTIAANVLEHGTGAINIDACRVATEEPIASHHGTGGGAGHTTGRWQENYKSGDAGRFTQALGRWPANVIHDGSEEVVTTFPEVHGAGAAGYSKLSEAYNASSYHLAGAEMFRIGDAGGSASRFFYTAKADADDRIGSKHPTVKPLDLMQYLVRLVTPPRGLVLDPFAGTGTTAEAAWREGFSAVLIEREVEYAADIERRMSVCAVGQDARRRIVAAALGSEEPIDAGPLFAGAT